VSNAEESWNDLLAIVQRDILRHEPFGDAIQAHNR